MERDVEFAVDFEGAHFCFKLGIPVAMNSPSKKENPSRMDELPLCTICHDFLSNDLSCLACGHIFHTHCITQQF